MPPKKPFTILFEDQHLVVINKAAGVLSQGDHSNQRDLVSYLRKHFGRHYVGLIHRLDRNVSGAMVVAKRTKAASRLSEALREGKIKRIYYAIVEGQLTKKQTINNWLVKDARRNLVRVVTKEVPQAKEAILELRPLASGIWRRQPVSCIEIRLKTGRSHQIRAQMAAFGHPVLGDMKYGHDKHELPRPMLHALQIAFPYPMTQEMMQYEAPLPDDMKKLVHRL